LSEFERKATELGEASIQLTPAVLEGNFYMVPAKKKIPEDNIFAVINSPIVKIGF
jgi:hypothetical protein